jgi:hypothetical protein
MRSRNVILKVVVVSSKNQFTESIGVLMETKNNRTVMDINCTRYCYKQENTLKLNQQYFAELRKIGNIKNIIPR